MLTDLFARPAAIVTRRQVGDLAPVDKAGYVPSLNLQARVAASAARIIWCVLCDHEASRQSQIGRRRHREYSYTQSRANV